MNECRRAIDEPREIMPDEDDYWDTYWDPQ